MKPKIKYFKTQKQNRIKHSKPIINVKKIKSLLNSG